MLTKGDPKWKTKNNSPSIVKYVSINFHISHLLNNKVFCLINTKHSVRTFEIYTLDDKLGLRILDTKLLSNRHN